VIVPFSIQSNNYDLSVKYKSLSFHSEKSGTSLKSAFDKRSLRTSWLCQ